MIVVYDLPEDILSTLQVKDNASVSQPSSKELDQKVVQPLPTQENDLANDTDSPSTVSCSTCGLLFNSHLDQRSHVRSDLHRYNTKRRLNELSSLTEEEFEELIASLSKIQVDFSFLLL